LDCSAHGAANRKEVYYLGFGLFNAIAVFKYHALVVSSELNDFQKADKIKEGNKYI
jgi:hypothetical protein